MAGLCEFMSIELDLERNDQFRSNTLVLVVGLVGCPVS